MKIKALTTSVVIMFFIFILTLSSCFNVVPSDTGVEETSASENQSATTTQKEQQSQDNSANEPTESDETGTTAKEPFKEQIAVTTPQPNDNVDSPLIIEGEARGTWFFEASFPVKLLDADGNMIAVHFAQAQGEWMTEDFVPFSSQLIFETPVTDTGVLILEKDNPSGLPENDASIEIPVRFNLQEKIIGDCNPLDGEYFTGAILKSIDEKNNIIIVEQLINGPDEKIISPEVSLADDCKVVKIILERPEEKEIVSEISLEDIKPGNEIGIIFRADNTARAIIYQEIVEN